MKWGAYARLSRLHKPSGTILLWVPTGNALWIANQGHPSIYLISLFFLGTVFMRAAGCILNDIADRHIDLHVARTKLRPLTSGEVSLLEALSLLAGYLLLSLLILLQLPTHCFIYAVVALLITTVYPFSKRFFDAPQLLLSMAFSMGIPMAFAASSYIFQWPMYLLFAINFFWILAYDTMYAMADREDDIKIGVKSTAVLLGPYDVFAITLCQVITHLMWLPMAFLLHFTYPFYGAWLIAGIVLLYQQQLISSRNAQDCMKAFSTSSVYGLTLWVGVVLR